MSLSYWPIVVSKVSWHCSVLLGQPAGVFISLCAVLQVGSGLAFLHCHIGGAKEQVDEPSGFSSVFCCTEVSVFFYKSHQCISDLEFWNQLNSADLGNVLLTKLLFHFVSFDMNYYCYHLEISRSFVIMDLCTNIHVVWSVRVLFNYILMRIHVSSRLTVVETFLQDSL